MSDAPRFIDGLDAEFRQALALADRILDRPNADPDDDLAVLARQLNRSAPWRLFYGLGAKLGEVAEIMGGSIYDYSPWLTTPAMNIAQRATEGEGAKIKTLTEALTPFSVFAGELFARNYNSTDRLMSIGDADLHLSVGEFFAARRAVAEQNPSQQQGSPQAPVAPDSEATS